MTRKRATEHRGWAIGILSPHFRAVVTEGPVAPSIEESAAFAREIAAAASRPGATVEIAE